MRIHSIFWALFVMVFLFYLGLYVYVYTASGHHTLNLFTIETSGAKQVRQIISAWTLVRFEGRDLLYYARLSTWVDFLWILSYVGVLIMVSYNIMQRQRNPFLNNLLRFTFLLVVIAGLLDVMEDIILLYDMHGWSPEKRIYSAAIFGWPKWILIALVLLSWLLTLVNSIVSSRKSYYFEKTL